MDSIKILVADDHTLVRKGTAKVLSQFPDFQIVGEAADGEEALALMDRLKPDVLLTDIRMPKMNALVLARQIRARFPHCKIIILSAYDDDDYVASLFRIGISGYLLKTVDLLELAQTIRTVHEGQVVISPEIAAKISRGLQAAEDRRKPNFSLTEREQAIIGLAAAGLENRQIARKLNLSVRTVEGHLGHIYAKFSVTDREQAICLARENGIVTNDQLPFGGRGD